jgi:ABC-type Zn2+ transport system substrate-binding protein/surface adhesin
MKPIRTLLFGMVTLALLLAPPLRAQFHLHSVPAADVAALDGNAAHDHGHAHHDHGHAHDDEPGHAGHKPHNPGDHSHESAVAVRLVDPMAGPVPRTILIVEAMDGLSQTHFRLERPPRFS